MSTATVWGWSLHEDGDEGWQGMETREAAIDAAREALEESIGEEDAKTTPIFIQAGELYDPYLLVEAADEIMDRMVDGVCDADPAPADFIDDPVFFKEGAEEALEMVLKVWARQYVECKWWEPIGKPEKIDPEAP